MCVCLILKLVLRCQVRDTRLPKRAGQTRDLPFPTFFRDGDEELPEDLYADDMFQFGEEDVTTT